MGDSTTLGLTRVSRKRRNQHTRFDSPMQIPLRGPNDRWLLGQKRLRIGDFHEPLRERSHGSLWLCPALSATTKFLRWARSHLEGNQAQCCSHVEA